MADTSPATLRVVAIYDRAAGLGDVLLGPGIARRHAAGAVDSVLFVAGGVVARRSLARYASDHPEVQALSRGEYLGTVRAAGADGAWGVWLVVGLGTAFAVLALINTAAMTTTERRGELATIRLLGGTSGHVTRMVMLETVPTVIAALGAGAAIVAVAVAGVPRGLTGFPLVGAAGARRRAGDRRGRPRLVDRCGDDADRPAGLARGGPAGRRVKPP